MACCELLDARQYVDKICMAAGIPLVESGTAGYLGQVQPPLKCLDRTECFDCIPNPTPKSFPVCIIRSTPSQPIHCIVWAKCYLLPQSFGDDEDGGTQLDEAEKQGEMVSVFRHSQEIAALRKDALAYKAVRNALRSPKTTDDAAMTVFQKPVVDGKHVAFKTPLDFDAIVEGSFVVKEPTIHLSLWIRGRCYVFGHANGASSSNGALKDRRALTLQDNLALFVSSTKRLASLVRAGEETISFDKDDDDSPDFVTAASNLRSAVYYIERKTHWEVKEMAGNIIPAIAPPNATISGLIVLQAMYLLRKSYTALKNEHVQFKPAVPLSTVNLCPPNPKCGIRRDTYAKGIWGDGEGEDGETGKREVSVYENRRVLSDPDWDHNDVRMLESLGVPRGRFSSNVDEEGEWGTIGVALCELPPDIVTQATVHPSPVDAIAETVEALSAKRAKTNGGARAAAIQCGSHRSCSTTSQNVGSPSMKKRLEEEGLVLLESATDGIGEIVID
ncbi:hypothetical protein OG21DRAFT_1525417 [Imleria badia]|nr:hypothetical protein OG21DRAFT_1525417 [Imleria badia]